MRYLIILFIFNFSLLSAQDSASLTQLSNLRFSSVANNQPIELKGKKVQASSLIFVFFYHHFLEKQDAQKCVFSPTCFDYWTGLVSTNGFFTAWIMACDRISKCPSMNVNQYSQLPNGLLIDPLP